MTKERFEQEILALRGMLYYVSYSLLGNPADQDDAVQEALRRALEKRASLREEKKLKSWLTRILVNECYNILRRRKREVPVQALVVQVPPAANGILFAALMAMEDRLRLPLVLHHYEGYTTREIAQILRVPEGTIKGRLVRARKALASALNEEEG